MVTTGNFNTAIGVSALERNTTGNQNTAIGFDALSNNTPAATNGHWLRRSCATHRQLQHRQWLFGALQQHHRQLQHRQRLSALDSNTTGDYNTAAGRGALQHNTNGDSNTATGTNALESNTTGGYNTATGDSALAFNTIGSYNIATGPGVLESNTTGSYNLANGYLALYSNTTGVFNMGNGAGALYKNRTGNSNVAEGLHALYNNTTGGSNIAIGTSAGTNPTTGSANIDIGNAGVAGESHTIRIGTQGTQTIAYMAGIRGVAVPGGVGVMIGSNGKLGTVVSSARFKEMIEPMDKASEAILSLKPVTFQYKKEWDPEGIRQYGLVAEEVEKWRPANRADEKGKPYSVRYEAINAMLLNEFLKEHHGTRIEIYCHSTGSHYHAAKDHALAQQQKDSQATAPPQQKQIDALTAGLQKVSAQLEATKPAPQVVNNP